MLFDYGCTGGTYGPLHDGHKKLFEIAFGICKFLVIRLTTDEYLKSKQKPFAEKIPSYEKRLNELYNYLFEQYPFRFEILPLGYEEKCKSCEYGKLTKVLFVGDDSFEGACRLNEQRRADSLYELSIVVVPAARDRYGKRISSTRIRKGEIDVIAH